MQSVTGMKLREAVEFLDALELSLRKTYDCFPRRIGAAESMMPARSEWGVQITAGAKAIEKAAMHLRKTIIEAEPEVLL